jgi:hypothetical protein
MQTNSQELPLEELPAIPEIFNSRTDGVAEVFAEAQNFYELIVTSTDAQAALKKLEELGISMNTLGVVGAKHQLTETSSTLLNSAAAVFTHGKEYIQ